MKKKSFSGTLRKVLATAMAIAVGLTMSGPSLWVANATAVDQQTGTVSLQKTSAQKISGDYAKGQVIVMFDKDEMTTSEAKKINNLDEGDSLVAKTEVEEVWDFDETVALISSDSLTTKQMIRKYEDIDYVKHAEPNYRIHIYTTNDPMLDKQWGLTDGQPDGSGGIGVNKQWDSGNTGKVTAEGEKDNIVAIVDTGIDYTHEDLSANMWKNTHRELAGKYGYDFIDGDEPMDENGHGTHVAGIIGAVGNNGVGISGVCQDVKLMALRILDAEGYGWSSDEISAYNYINKALDLGENIVAINNSWGGGEYSQIMEELITTVGEKGAVTVCAAGNDSLDNDENLDYPSCYESPYKISVASTTSEGKLSYFSNYGDESVDLAAPGSDILSSVCYTTYFPILYGGRDAALQKTNSQYYEDGSVDWENGEMDEDSTVNFDDFDAADIYNGIQFSGTNDDYYSWDTENDDALKAAIATYSASSPEKPDGAASYGGSFPYVVIPYEVPEDYDPDSENQLRFTANLKLLGPALNFEEYFSGTAAFAAAVDISQETLDKISSKADGYTGDKVFADAEIYGEATGYYFDGYSSTDWYSFQIQCAADENVEPGDQRYIIIFCDYLKEGKNYSFYLDGCGLSNYTDGSTFGKYDILSGTSMAAPHVSGAVALAAAAQKNDPAYNGTYDIDATINTVLSSVRTTEELEKTTITGGALDFNKLENNLGVRVKEATVNTATGEITITGGGFDLDNLQISLSLDGKNYVEAAIAEDGEGNPMITDKSVTIKSEDIAGNPQKWINNIVSIKATGLRGDKVKTSVKKNIYLIKGKDSFEEKGEVYGNYEALTTDGKMVYSADSNNDALLFIDPAKNDAEECYIGQITNGFLKDNYESFSKQLKTAIYDFRFGNDLVYADGMLYTVGSFAEVSMGSSDIFIDSESSTGKSILNSSKKEDYVNVDSFDPYDVFPSADGFAYAGEDKLLCIAADGSTDFQCMGNLPAGLDRTFDYSIGAYNGKIYIVGGYDYSLNDNEGGVSTAVYVYNPANGKWTNGPALPEGRAGGELIQSGNSLVYTLGYADSTEITGKKAPTEIPANLIFDGSSWTESSINLEAFSAITQTSRGGQTFAVYDSAVSLAKGGLVYAGLPVKDYGDTFTYNIKSDAYAGSNFNYFSNPYDATTISGIAIGENIYSFDTENWVTLVANKAIEDGYARVTAEKSSKGTVKGANKDYVPGTEVTISVTPKAGYYVKSFKIGSTSATGKGLSITKRLTGTEKASITYAKYSISVNKTKATVKAGTKYRIKASIAPSKAAKQRSLVYTSSNKKYATVSSTGVVTTKKAGKGKTVTITVKAKGTASPSKTVKLTLN